MKPITKQSDKKTAFTIIELLTVMSIIVILIGLLVPSLQMAKRYAKEVRQKAQFHSIDVAMELYKNEFEDYPDSARLDGADKPYPGATRLCEAMLGQDLLGFHPLSRFRADCSINASDKIYDNPPAGAVLYLTTAENLKARKGPYLQLEKTSAYRLSDIYGIDGVGDITPSLFVLCDVYNRVKNVTTGKGIGMPILYYKADTAGIRHDPNKLPTPGDPPNKQGNFYDYSDNVDITVLGMPWNPSVPHPMYTTPKIFYINTKNDKIELKDGRPYRADSYILLSAGFDGQYGTPDDIFNFEKE